MSSRKACTNIATASAFAEEVEHQVFLKPFSDDRAWDAILISTEIKSLVQINTVCIVEIGKRLVFAKNNVPAGRWLDFLKSVNVAPRTSQIYMRAAQKMLEFPKLKQLEAAGISKLDEILRADDKDLQDFEDSGVFMGKPVDELKAMTREELKALVRGTDKRLEETKKQFDEQDQQIASLQDTVEKLQGAPVDEETFFVDLHNTRRSIMGELESYLRHVRETEKPVETIGVYLLLDQVKGYCKCLQDQLEQNTPIGSFLMDTIVAHDSTSIQLTDLGETATKEAADLGLTNNGDDTSDGA